MLHKNFGRRVLSCIKFTKYWPKNTVKMYMLWLLFVIPAQAGIQKKLRFLGSRLRGCVAIGKIEYIAVLSFRA